MVKGDSLLLQLEIWCSSDRLKVGRSIAVLMQICFAVSNCNGNATQKRGRR
ncbi:hypothetical protein H6G76_24375 [Nostoc sp. FACHB-152]|uniref:hypothetical protein n=1 Tax=Nostoc sp. FACHB-152 TaxID=2692837 RepID=UPI0016830B7E|nr:hypothetical protein [Nostoc sp. FACHB-152]MBD2450241.1 hypothetical protein [Nostoc sp. FACHB-152]